LPQGKKKEKKKRRCKFNRMMKSKKRFRVTPANATQSAFISCAVTALAQELAGEVTL